MASSGRFLLTLFGTSPLRFLVYFSTLSLPTCPERRYPIFYPSGTFSTPKALKVLHLISLYSIQGKQLSTPEETFFGRGLVSLPKEQASGLAKHDFVYYMEMKRLQGFLFLLSERNNAASASVLFRAFGVISITTYLCLHHSGFPLSQRGRFDQIWASRQYKPVWIVDLPQAACFLVRVRCRLRTTHLFSDWSDSFLVETGFVAYPTLLLSFHRTNRPPPSNGHAAYSILTV